MSENNDYKDSVSRSIERINKFANSFSEALRKQMDIYNIEPIITQLSPFFDVQLPKIMEAIKPLYSYQFDKITEQVKAITESPIISQIQIVADNLRNVTKAFTDALINNNALVGIQDTLREVKNNPNSIFNWMHYYDALTEYYWITPYKMPIPQLKELLETITSEKDFDAYCRKYFTKDLVNELFDDIYSRISKKKDKVYFNEIREAYNHRLYAIANTGLVCMIDNQLSKYMIDKKNLTRTNLFKFIAFDIESKIGMNNEIVFKTLMMNSNINRLYEDVEFNKGIKVNTQKQVRRNTIAHGKMFSARKIDFIMILNTYYYLLELQPELVIYERKLDTKKEYNKEKNTTKTYFYIPNTKERKEIKSKIKTKMEKKKSIEKNFNK